VDKCYITSDKDDNRMHSEPSMTMVLNGKSPLMMHANISDWIEIKRFFQM